MTDTEFETEVDRITVEHLTSIHRTTGLMRDLAGPAGFGRRDIDGILIAVQEALGLAIEQLRQLGRGTPS